MADDKSDGRQLRDLPSVTKAIPTGTSLETHESWRQQEEALRAIRAFLQSKTSYDVLPVSFKLVMLDTTLTLKGALLTLLQNGIISAPMWDSHESRFAGLLTASDFLNVLRYYIDQPKLLEQLHTITLDDLRGIETEMGAQHAVEARSINPMVGLWDACQAIIDSRAHRMPLVDVDSEAKREIIVSVLTQYRILRFVALNCKETQNLEVQIKDLDLATTENISHVTMESPLRDLIRIFSERGVSAVPVTDPESGRLMNMYETFDVLTLLKGSGFSDLDMTVGEALMRRPQDFEGVLTCAPTDRLADIFETIRRSRLLRLFVVDENDRLTGVVSLCDILRYLCQGP